MVATRAAPVATAARACRADAEQINPAALAPGDWRSVTAKAARRVGPLSTRSGWRRARTPPDCADKIHLRCDFGEERFEHPPGLLGPRLDGAAHVANVAGGRARIG
jgi:hypothetical protein